jgi:ornithine carbamoyltransferase
MSRPLAIRHFLDIAAIDRADLRAMLDLARDMKHARQGRHKGVRERSRPLDGMILATVFEKPSTRTRVSFDVAMRQLGGDVIVLSGAEMQLGRGETVADTARVLSRYVDIVMLRATLHDHLTELAENATVPVINGLTDHSHPCQIMADLMTFEEHKGPIDKAVIAWVGDGNNVATSWIEAAGQFGFELRFACPPDLGPAAGAIEAARAKGATITVSEDPFAAVDGADCVVTDTWVSMGDKGADRRIGLLTPFRVTEDLMAKAGNEAIFMHCLPAHRGEEVVEAVIDGPQSVVFDEAENRLHAQKAVLTWCAGVKI